MTEIDNVPDSKPLDEGDKWRSGSKTTTIIHLISGGVSGTLLFALMAVTAYDVIGRYGLDSPLPGGSEIIQMIMAAIIYSALPSVNRQESHITVDLLDSMTPNKLVRPRQILVTLLTLVMLSVITWALWVLAVDLRDVGETWAYLGFSRAPIVYFMCLCSFAGSLLMLVNLIRYIRGVDRPEPGFV